jgi:hypothetical protein
MIALHPAVLGPESGPASESKLRSPISTMTGRTRGMTTVATTAALLKDRF